MDSYRKIVRLSNTFYNAGLEKAKVRDLSGAAECLRKSLRFYKGNTQARNLLGLIYYEMGEVVDAISEWVISRSLAPEDNIAENYLSSVQSNRNYLNTVNQTIKKYNQALLYCQQDSKDLAVIQLKKVLSLNPRLVKARQLLALLYMEEGKNDLARKELRAAAKVDANNTVTLRYMQEAGQSVRGEKEENPKKSARKEKKELVSYRSGNDTIIQPVNFKDNSAVITIVNIVIGVAIGIAITFFLILPATRQNATSDAKKAEVEANNAITTKNQEIKKLEENVEDLQSQMKQMESETAASEEVNSNYEKLLLAYDAYAREDIKAAGEALAKVKEELLGESSKPVYATINAKVNEQFIKDTFQEASSAYNSKKYEEAIPNLEKVVEMQEDYDDGNALYYLAQSYRKTENWDNAKRYYLRLIELHPDTSRARSAQKYLNEIEKKIQDDQGNQSGQGNGGAQNTGDGQGTAGTQDDGEPQE